MSFFSKEDYGNRVHIILKSVERKTITLGVLPEDGISEIKKKIQELHSMIILFLFYFILLYFIVFIIVYSSRNSNRKAISFSQRGTH